MASITNTEATPVYKTNFNSSSPDELFHSFVEAVATVEETPPAELRPLQEVIDIDALERFIVHAAEIAANPEAEICIPVNQWEVLITCDGDIHVYSCEVRTEEQDGSS